MKVLLTIEVFLKKDLYIFIILREKNIMVATI